MMATIEFFREHPHLLFLALALPLLANKLVETVLWVWRNT